MKYAYRLPVVSQWRAIMKSKKIVMAVALICAQHGAQAAVINSGGGQFVWTDLVGALGQTTCDLAPCNLSSISGLTGSSIKITRIGIGGDSDATSGDNTFRLFGGGLDFTWTAGQENFSATYDLGATPLSGTSRGFAYSPVLSLLANDGASLNIQWTHHTDFDLLYTDATDVLGNVFNDIDSLASIRPWIQFEYVSNQQQIPEPGSLALLGLGIAALLTSRKRT